MSFLDEARKLLRENIREYGMFIALFVIMAYFAFATDGLFISSRNIVNLVNQTGYIAVLAVGMTLVIVIRHIDLSVGFLAGFLGAVAAISMTSWNLSVYLTIPLVLGLGILAGLLTSTLVAELGIPAFVATLAGWLGYRGALQLATRATGTIIIPNDTFNAIGNKFIPDIRISASCRRYIRSRCCLACWALFSLSPAKSSTATGCKSKALKAYQRRCSSSNWCSSPL